MRPKLAMLLIVALVCSFGVRFYLTRGADTERGPRKPPPAEQFVAADDLREVTGEPPVAPGMKAVPLKVNAEPTSAPFVLPHSHVDIVSVVRGNDGSTHSETILENIPLLAPSGSEKADTVMVLVTPEQSQRLAVAQKMGTISVVPRPLVYPGIDP
jgi:Flp pilus assembly protein CpaB